MELNNNQDELRSYLHDRDLYQESIDQDPSQMHDFKEESKKEKKKVVQNMFKKINKNKVIDYKIKKKSDERKIFSNQNSPKMKLLKESTNKNEKVKSENEERKEESSKSSNKIVEMIVKSFKENNHPPDTSVDFYRAGKILGKGAFGKVSLALHKLSKKLVALKLLNKEFLKNETSKEKVMQEVKILKRFRHPNVVKLFETFESSKHIVVVMEL